MALGRQHGAIEVEGQPGEALAQKARQDQLPKEPTQLLHVGVPHAPQGAGERGHVRQTPQPQQTLHQRVVAVVVDVAQSPEAQQQVHDQPQDDPVRTEALGPLPGTETRLQPSLQVEVLEQRLEHDQAAEGGQLLVLEPQRRDLVKTAHNLLFAALHLRCPPGSGATGSFSTPLIRIPSRHRK